jgi:hypothetical protein
MTKCTQLLCSLVSVLALAGCGDDDTGGGTTSTSTGAGGGGGGGGAGAGGGGGGPDITRPDVEGVTFVAAVDNPYFPLPVGASWTYESTTPEGVERIEVSVSAETKTIQGVVATVVKDTVYLDDVIIEDTFDWYAQDSDGNVWYLGEDTCEFVDGVCDGVHAGAWEWGVDGALPGIIMPATPTVDGQPYYQEYYPGVAEDVGEVIEVDVSVTVPAGMYTDCIKTHDTSTLDPELDENKIYCRGIGNVFVEEPDFDVELTMVSGL